jgi:hypothetical protein
MFNEQNEMSPLFSSDIISNEKLEQNAGIIPEGMMIPSTEEEIKSKQLYRATDLKEMYGVSPVTLSQYKDGQTVTRGDKRYVYPPIFENGVDYILDGGKIFYTESARQKVKASLGSKKRGRKPNPQKETNPAIAKGVSSEPKQRGRKALKETPQELVDNGFTLFNEICEKFNIKYQKLYTLFSKFKKGEINGVDGNPVKIEEGVHFVSDGIRIALHESLISQILSHIQNSTRKPRTSKTRMINSEEISLIYGSRIFKVTQEEAQKIIDALSETSKKKMSRVED